MIIKKFVSYAYNHNFCKQQLTAMQEHHSRIAVS